MLDFFAKKKKCEFVPAVTGKKETTAADLTARFGGQLNGRLYYIDISEQLADLPGNTKLPKKVQQLVRDVLDEYLKSEKEFYFQIEEKKFGLFFSAANKSVAELKVQVIRNELARVIEEAKRKKEAIPPVPERTVEVKPRSRGTLSPRPDEIEMREWANRALANMTTKHGYDDLYADIYKLSEIIRVRYAPVWFAPNRIISGYAARPTVALTRKTYSDRQAHEDLAILGAAIRQLKDMRERGEFALIVVPVWVQTVCRKTTRDLYNIYCRGLDTQLKNFIVLQLKGMDTLTPSQSDWEALRGLSWHCRAVIVDTGMKKISPKKMGSMKFHTFGFDLADIGAPEDQLFKVLDDYAAYYQRYRKETFVLGIESHSLFAAALGSGFSYISGPAISPLVEAPRHAAFFSLEKVYERILPAG